MKSPQKLKNRGSAYLLAIFSFALLSGVAATIHHTTTQEYSVNHTRKAVETCNNSAESGLAYFQTVLDGMRSASTFGKLPDMRDTLYSYLRDNIKQNGVTVTKSENGNIISVSKIATGDIQFDAEFAFTDYVDDTPTNLGSAFRKDAKTHKVPSKIVAIITGYKGNTVRRLKTEFSISVDSDILKYAISSAVRVTLRGKIRIHGDIFSTWSRTNSSAYAFDIGNKYSKWRKYDDIEISGKIISSLNKNQFIHDSNWKDGIRYAPLRDKFYDEAPNVSSRSGAAENPNYDEGKEAQDKFEWGRENVTKISHHDIDTSEYKKVTKVDILKNCEREFENDQNKYSFHNRHIYKYYDREIHVRGFISGDGRIIRQVYVEKNSPEYKNAHVDNDTYYKQRYIWKDENNNKYTGKRPPVKKCNRFWYGGYGHVIIEQNGTAYAVFKNQPKKNSAIPPRVKRYTRWGGSKYKWRDVIGQHSDYKTKKTVFKNLKIPAGSNAHFKNCTFKGVTYIQTNEKQDLRGYGYWSNFKHGTANNVVFDNCKFEGPIISGVPKSFRYRDNAITFEGNTVFDNKEIEKTARGVTILAPNFNINIGDLDQSAGSQSTTTLTGVVLGGLIDIRDNAHITGTLINMADYEHLNDRQVAAGWASNIGNCEQGGETTGGFTPSKNIVLKSDPDNVLPIGFKRRYLVKAVPGSYQQLGN